ncbi:hypothetical protein GYB22_03530 [bacterium]|nr:hypothetical protein [bacterium]
MTLIFFLVKVTDVKFNTASVIYSSLAPIAICISFFLKDIKKIGSLIGITVLFGSLLYYLDFTLPPIVSLFPSVLLVLFLNYLLVKEGSSRKPQLQKIIDYVLMALVFSFVFMFTYLTPFETLWRSSAVLALSAVAYQIFLIGYFITATYIYVKH